MPLLALAMKSDQAHTRRRRWAEDEYDPSAESDPNDEVSGIRKNELLFLPPELLPIYLPIFSLYSPCC